MSQTSPPASSRPLRLLRVACVVTALLCPLLGVGALPGAAGVGAVARLAGAETFMPVDEVKPGMHATGVTVLQGDTRTTFDIDILGVERNLLGPRRHLILGRLAGPKVTDIGVLQGMSGSPVYIDGKLVGALSFAMGPFPKEPICGITPIGDMIDATSRTTGPSPAARRAAAGLEWPASPKAFAAALSEALASLVDQGRPLSLAGSASPVLAGLGGGDLRLEPIATPFTVSGFSGDTADTFRRVLGASATAGAGADTALPRPAAGALAPGDAVGISLIGGDLTFAATGTVTHVDGTKVYAFGHPFFNLGPTDFPMTKAWVYGLLPSLQQGRKMATIGDVVGTMHQDRATAIAGTLGPGPAMVPVKLTLTSDGGPARAFTFQVVKDQLFTPVLTFAAIANTLQAYEREFGVATFTVRGTARVRDYGAIAMEDVFAGDAPAIGAAASISGPLAILLKNERAPVQIDGVDIDIQSFEEPRTASIERVWLGTRELKRGAQVPVYVVTRSYRGEERTHTIPIQVPLTAAGTVSLTVSDGSRLAMAEQREVRPPSTTDSVGQVVRAFNKARRNNRIYVKLTTAVPGAVVAGEAEPALPPSVLAVVEGAQPGATVLPLSSLAIGEWDVPTDEAVSGQRTLTVTVKPL